MRKLSEYYTDCCGAAPKGNGDCDTMDFEICPECGEHCEYVLIGSDRDKELSGELK